MSRILSEKGSSKFESWMLPLKVYLFFVFGANFSILPYIQVYLKQKGLTVGEIAIIYAISSCLQFLFLVTSGIMIDKLKNSKLIILGTLTLTTLTLNGMVFVPDKIDVECKESEPFFKDMNCFELPSKLQMFNLKHMQKQVLKCYYDKSFDHTLCHNTNKTTKCFRGIDLTEPNENIASLYNQDSTLFAVGKHDGHSDVQEISEEIPLIHYDCIDKCNNNSYEYLLILRFFPDNNSCNARLESKEKLYFVLLMILFLGHQTLLVCSLNITDIIIMSFVRTYSLDFGREKFWSVISGVLFSILSGYMVVKSSEAGNAINYENAIYLFNACTFIAAIAVCGMNIKVEKQGQRLLEKSTSISTLLVNVDIIVFFMIVLILGTCFNFAKYFSLLYLDSLGATSLLLALKSGATIMYGLPFLIFSNIFVENIGKKNLFLLAFVAYVANFIGYAYLINPWWSLVIELTGIFSHHLLWVAVVQYSYSVAPVGLTSTFIAISAALHFCIGSGTGSLLGGLIMDKYGGHTAYKVMAITAGTSGLLYALYLCVTFLCARRRKEYSLITSDKLVSKELVNLN